MTRRRIPDKVSAMAQVVSASEHVDSNGERCAPPEFTASPWNPESGGERRDRVSTHLSRIHALRWVEKSLSELDPSALGATRGKYPGDQ